MLITYPWLLVDIALCIYTLKQDLEKLENCLQNLKLNPNETEWQALVDQCAFWWRKPKE